MSSKSVNVILDNAGAEAQSDFYPTPSAIADILLSDINWHLIETILEPSAGKGDLAKAAENASTIRSGSWVQHSASVDCIEIDPTLRAVLKESGCRVVHDDFITYRTHKHYDLIVMNPPFSHGAKHLMKALEMQKDGGMIRCILNAETIRNPYSYERQQLVARLQELGAVVTFHKKAFASAERRTDVDIAIVKVDVPRESKSGFILESLRKAHEYAEVDENGEYTAVAKGNIVDAIVDRYNYEVECGIKFIREWKSIKKVINSSVKEGDKAYSSTILDVKVKDGLCSENEFVCQMRMKYWSALFDNDMFMARMTENLRTELRSQVSKLKDYEFSAFNIYEIMVQFNDRITKGVDDTIMGLFDDWTRKYHWDENAQNRHYFDGWRTNDAFKVNKKVIIPFRGAFDWYDGSLDVNSYQVVGKMADIEKVFDFLAGDTAPESIGVRAILNQAQKERKSRNVQFKYFTVTFYKKGTAHITFTDNDILKKFNLHAARGKGWLPPVYGKKHYKDMSADEKAVVKSFQGEEDYEETLARSDYFLTSSVNTGLFLAAPLEG